MSDSPDTGGFYFDPEILRSDPVPSVGVPPPFTPDLFAYLQSASASAATFSPSFDQAPSLSNTPPRSLPDIGVASPRPGESPGERGTGVVRSEQVGTFWERYNAYPRYLKNLTKRMKRKNQKARVGSA
jgi:hypothetical protein